MFNKHIWLGFAVFFLIFSSNPIKKYIQLAFFHQSAPIETSTGERVSNSIVKVCAIVDRHELSSKSLQIVHQQAPDNTDLLILFTELISFALLYFSRTYHKDRGHSGSSPSPGNLVPLYLAVRQFRI